MEVKIDTKEHFRVFSPRDREIHANLAEELKAALLDGLGKAPYHAILALPAPLDVQGPLFQAILAVHQAYLARNASFVVAAPLREGSLQDQNVWEQEGVAFAPTLSEAGDLLMMEILERELLGDDPASGPAENNRSVPENPAMNDQ